LIRKLEPSLQSWRNGVSNGGRAAENAKVEKIPRASRKGRQKKKGQRHGAGGENGQWREGVAIIRGQLGLRWFFGGVP